MLTEKKHKELIKASLMELMTENKEFFREIFSELIEDAGMVAAIQKGRKNKFVGKKYYGYFGRLILQIKYEASFEKDLKKIQDANLLKQLKKLITIIKEADSTLHIPQIKKLKDHDTSYRIKIGNYRIGFEMVNDELILTRILHRKEIYRYFP